MYVFIVNLEHEHVKRAIVEEQLQREHVSYEFVRAVDGQNDDLDQYSFLILPQWAEPFTRKTITKGEIGCALSHYFLWKRIVDEQLPYALILEDDVTIGHDFLATVEKQLEHAPEYDLMYLGRKPLRESSETIIDSFVKVKYSYGTHAYLLTYQGAKKLVEGDYLQHMIPVDEYLPLLYDPDYPHKEYISYFKPIPFLAYSVTPLLVHPIGGESYKSTTYHSDPYRCKFYDDYIVLSVGTSPNDALTRFETSCQTYGHPYKILGLHTEWTGGNMSQGPGGGQKINLLYQELITWTTSELERFVLFTDSYDVIFVSNPKEVFQKYNELTQGNHDLIVFSSEPTCWPDKSLASLYPSEHYLNSGGFMGKAKHILSLLEIVPPTSDDQLYYTHQFLKSSNLILDKESTLFQTLNQSNISILNNGRVQNTTYHTHPCILHGTGPSSVKRYLNFIENYTCGWSSVYKCCITHRPSYTPKVYINSSYLPELEYPTEQLICKSIPLQDMVHDFLSTDAEYLLVIEPRYHITNPSTLIDLLSMNKTIVGPMVKKQSAWSNFWGDISESGYYKRSSDYMDIIQYTKKAVWNVPYLTGIYLVRRCFLESFPDVYTFESDIDMTFAKNVRDSHHFMYVSNLDVYGYIEDGPSIMNIQSPVWEQDYIHPDYLAHRSTLSSICKEPCQDMYCFPIFTKRFCDELIELCESLNNWSNGRSDVLDPRINAYENVPTRDIHLHQLNMNDVWETIIRTYIAPVASAMYNSHKTKKTNISFVVKYSMDGQRELSPHHDSSIYTINICLNNEFEGGGCYFIRQKCFLEHKQIGYATMHPGRLTHYHEGKQIVSGTRYILVSFVE